MISRLLLFTNKCLKKKGTTYKALPYKPNKLMIFREPPAESINKRGIQVFVSKNKIKIKGAKLDRNSFEIDRCVL